MLECAGRPAARKFDTNSAGRSGALYMVENSSMREVQRSDGSVSVDKTHKLSSHPTAKLKVRNANRSLTKRARQSLKRQMNEQAREDE